MTRMPVLILFALCLSTWVAVAADDDPGPIEWQSLDQETFAQAQAQSRFVLLNLEAVWCHWCHVMDEKTYADPEVAAIIARHYLPVREDHDARPDLAQRYRDYGWPATIVFAADGTEIVKRAGYMSPESFSRLLLAIVDDPSPEAAARIETRQPPARSPLLSNELRKELIGRFRARHDGELGGLDIAQKFLPGDHTELALELAAAGDAAAASMARTTLDGARGLIDPAWGGAFQYSTHGDWRHVHFEKIVKTQARYLRIYALAYALWGEPRDRRVLDDITRYLDRFLSAPDGAFYTSQDADLVQGRKATDYFALDDEQRVKQGIPRVDTNRYARQNGLLIEGLTMAYEATGEEAFLRRARVAARWVIEHRSLSGGGFRHAEEDAAGPYLGDSLAMGRAMLVLHRATGEREWLRRALSAADFIEARFRDPNGGYLAAAPEGSPIPPLPQIDEVISLTRFTNLLAHYTGNARMAEMAEWGMRYLATEAVALSRIEESGILLADRELSADPAHLTVVTPADSGLARDMYELALRQPGWYRRVDWWDRSGGPLMNPDVTYPNTGRPAGFVCANGRCSLPAFSVERFAELIDLLLNPASEAGIVADPGRTVGFLR